MDKIRSCNRAGFIFCHACNNLPKELFCNINNINFRTMQQRWTNKVLAIATIATLFTACKKDYSNDDPLPDVYTSSVFIGSQNQKVYAFNPNNGNKKWEWDAHSNILATPVMLGGSLYVPLTNGLICKLDPNKGKSLDTFYFAPSLVSSPAAEGQNTLYVADGNDTLYALNTGNKTYNWKFPTGGLIRSSPTVYKNNVIFGCDDGKVYAVDKNSGAQTWQYSAGGGVTFYSSPVAKGAFVYIGCSDGALYALDEANGTLKWKYQTGNAIESSPIAYGGNVIFGSNDYKLYCIDSASGLPRWVATTTDRIKSSPYADNQVVYVGCHDYNLYAFNIIDGTQKWKFTTGALIKSSPLVKYGKVYVGSDDFYLYALDTASGSVVWKQNINGLIETSPVASDADGTSYYPSISGASKY